MNYYSQHGEDILLNEIFKNKQAGFFVEVGCIDGKRFSNTLFFEKKGWKGMCVEAHSEYIDLIKKNRPNSIVAHYAAGEKNEDNVTFYANSRGSLSTLDKTKEKLWKKKYSEYFTGFEEQTVKKRRLDYLFKKYNIQNIDILSIDIEGYEVEALKGIDFNTYKPSVILIESDSKKHEQAMSKILLKYGYFKSITFNGNIFYLLDKNDHEKINNLVLNNKIIHTKHPVDINSTDKTINVIIDTRSIFTINIKKLLKNILNIFRKKNVYKFYDIGFHGDKYLIDTIFNCIKNAEQFIETGSNVGSSFVYALNNFPNLNAYSCEPDKKSFNSIIPRIEKFPNTKLYNEFSPDFLYKICKDYPEILSKNTVFWLDAHGHGYTWPLKKEIEFITNNFDSGFIFIDDFLVPNKDNFKYSRYDDQVCSFDFIKDSINTQIKYNLYYPNYNQKTSEHHPLTGWGMIAFGKNINFAFPDTIKNYLT